MLIIVQQNPPIYDFCTSNCWR